MTMATSRKFPAGFGFTDTVSEIQRGWVASLAEIQERLTGEISLLGSKRLDDNARPAYQIVRSPL